jgi:ribose transport system permease protein
MTIGVRIFAIGNDESAARAHGIPVRRVKVIAFALSGLLAAASGLFLAASTTGGDAAAGDVYILTSIAAVVLRISFYGGQVARSGHRRRFRVPILTERSVLAGINPLYQSFFQGLFLVLAVFLGVILGRLLKAGT